MNTPDDEIDDASSLLLLVMMAIESLGDQDETTALYEGVLMAKRKLERAGELLAAERAAA